MGGAAWGEAHPLPSGGVDLPQCPAGMGHLGTAQRGALLLSHLVQGRDTGSPGGSGNTGLPAQGHASELRCSKMCVKLSPRICCHCTWSSRSWFLFLRAKNNPQLGAVGDGVVANGRTWGLSKASLYFQQRTKHWPGSTCHWLAG